MMTSSTAFGLPFSRAPSWSVSARAGREFNVHRSTYYDRLAQVKLWGLDALRPRERLLVSLITRFVPWPVCDADNGSS